MVNPNPVLVTDFDGTVTRRDFFYLVVEHLLTPADIAPWRAYQAGSISHFAAVQSIFGKIRAPENEVLALLDLMEPDPAMPEYVTALREAGWRVIIVSAGCEWYINLTLDRLGVEGVQVYANPGAYRPGGPLDMWAPSPLSPFYSPTEGINKAAVVRRAMGGGPDSNVDVVYAGDGRTDVEAALMLPINRRFAKGDMADSLGRSGEEFRPFERWSEVAENALRRNF